MKKLTAEKCKKVIDGFKWMAAEGPGMSIRDEYDIQAYELALPILEQQERGEGEWIEWGGGARPVSSSVMIEPKLRTGKVMPPGIAAFWEWVHLSSDLDIIAYRIIPERTTNQNGEQ